MTTKKIPCPFCHRSNNCMVQSPSACWCMQVDIPNALIELLPEAAKEKSCICSACIELFNQDAKQFKNSYLPS